MGLSDQPFEIPCPDCGAMIKVDPVTRAVIAHTSAPRKRTFEDLNAAAKAAKDADARRDSIFAQSVEAQKNSGDVLAKKFAEAMKKAKESPDTGKPIRDFDLDCSLQFWNRDCKELGTRFETGLLGGAIISGRTRSLRTAQVERVDQRGPLDSLPLWRGSCGTPEGCCPSACH